MGLDHLWAACLDHYCDTVKMEIKFYLYCTQKSFHILFYFPICVVVVGLCVVTACWGSASDDWHSGFNGWNDKICWWQQHIVVSCWDHRKECLLSRWGKVQKKQYGKTCGLRGVPLLPGEGSTCFPWGEMKDICRGVVDAHDPMGWEFSLLTHWMPSSK